MDVAVQNISPVPVAQATTEVEECDATDDDSSTEVDNIINISN